MPEPEPEPELMELNLDPARSVATFYAETDAAFGALLEELLAVQARCKERIEAKVQECLSSKQTQLEIRHWVRTYPAWSATYNCQHAATLSVATLHESV